MSDKPQTIISLRSRNEKQEGQRSPINIFRFMREYPVLQWTVAVWVVFWVGAACVAMTFG